MASVASLTDFNRNQNAVLADLRDTQKPMYLTKNGKACAVIMDAEAFDRMMAEREETRSPPRGLPPYVTAKAGTDGVSGPVCKRRALVHRGSRVLGARLGAH